MAPSATSGAGGLGACGPEGEGGAHSATWAGNRWCNPGPLGVSSRLAQVYISRAGIGAGVPCRSTLAAEAAAVEYVTAGVWHGRAGTPR